MKRLMKHVQLPMLHDTADSMAMDFMAHRLPPHPTAPVGGQEGQRRGMPEGLAPHEEGVKMRLKCPGAMRLNIEVDPQGQPLLSILHSMFNTRTGHMGEPGAQDAAKQGEEDDGDDDEDEEDEEEDEEDDEDDEEAPQGPVRGLLQFPGSYGGAC